MTNKNNSSLFPFYHAYVNQKRKLYYISNKFLCLTLYMIVFYFFFPYNFLENSSLEIVKNCNRYKRNLNQTEKNSKRSKRKKNLKHKKVDIHKKKSNVNDSKCNEENIEKNKHCIRNDLENSNIENECSSSISNINYNDMSRNLTETELREVLNSFRVCPSKEDLRNIWNHTIGVAKEGFDDIQKELKRSIQKYLDNDIFVGTFICGDMRGWLYNNIWEENFWRFSRTISNYIVEYTNHFYNLINDEHTLDDILKFIYSFLKYFKTLKEELREKHQKELSEKIEKTLNKNKKKNGFYKN
ncbi:Plasmodium exported protein (PHISTa), unknown, putative [Plasmodium sp. gorilla clade G1]|nr:Plasmodium exported protein (PHISTa), unknown, putative [Plasmodium sp. gorilla clade G1]